jgi:hypothetical protein
MGMAFAFNIFFFNQQPKGLGKKIFLIHCHWRFARFNLMVLFTTATKHSANPFCDFTDI